jgi:hypothetical protein
MKLCAVEYFYKFLIILFCVNIFSLEINAKKKKFMVSGSITQTSSYCGGAAPPQDMLDRLAMPQSFPNCTFYIRKSKSNSFLIPTQKVTTDSNGNLKINLAPGNYCLILENKLKYPNTDALAGQFNIDQKCLKAEWNKCEYSIVVVNKNISFTYNVHRRCAWDQPCMQYFGPMPP